MWNRPRGKESLIAVEPVDMSMSVCHWCCHERPGPIVGIPFLHDERQKKFTCIAKVFCTFACARAYLHKEVRGALQIKGQSLLPILYKRMGGNLREYPGPAPPRTALRLFGGLLTIDEFRKISEDKIRVDVSYAPLEFAKEFINITGPPGSKPPRAKLSCSSYPTNRVVAAVVAPRTVTDGSGIMDFLTRKC